ncbi:MAG: type II secretion system F family protein [Phycisphaerales bacterium]
MSIVPRTGESFVFVAATATGGRTLGVRQAKDQRALAVTLRKERMLLMRSYRLPAWASRTAGLRVKDRADLNEQLAQLLSRGVPLVEALEVTASAVTPKSRPIIQRMEELVAAGSSFSDACQRVAVFDRVSVAVYQAAERTGDLAGTCKQLSITLRRQDRVAARVKTMMIYPVIVLAMSLGLGLAMLMYIVPMIGASLAQLGAPIPWYSQIVFGVGRAMRDNSLIVLFAFGGLALGAILLRRGVGSALGRVTRRLPVVRDVILASESARFFSVMAAMTRSGVPLAGALGVANETIGLPALKRQLIILRTRLIEGGVLRSLIEGVVALPLATRRLLIAAERAGDLETVFDTLAGDMADDVDRKTTRLLAVLEPALIGMMFLIIGSMVLAIMIPIITLTREAI